MAGWIQGITVEIGGDTTKLQTALKGVNTEMINCSDCRIPGVKTPYCDLLCHIRQCAIGKGMETCGGCSEMRSCEKVGAI